jgi:transcriptional regulator GlxA family with amidase domain
MIVTGRDMTQKIARIGSSLLHELIAGLPRPGPTRNIVMLVYEGVDLVDVSGPLSAFSLVNQMSGQRAYSLEVVANRAGTVMTAAGLELVAGKPFRDNDGEVDTVIIPGCPDPEAEPARDPAMLQWLLDISLRARRVCSVCTGAFILARAGLLDGHRATTHWAFCRELTDAFPNVEVETDPIFVRDGKICTSAGITAGMDLTLALIEEDLGRDWAMTVARSMVLYLRRPGGQAQFSLELRTQISDSKALKGLPQWIVENPEEDLRVDALASRVGMSPRNFARVFTRETGETPAKFAENARVDAAKRRLEYSPLPLETLARDLGFRSGERMRRSFQRCLNMTPDEYRRRFQAS